MKKKEKLVFQLKKYTYYETYTNIVNVMNIIDLFH